MKHVLTSNIKPMVIVLNIFTILFLYMFTGHLATHILFTVLSVVSLIYLRNKELRYWYLYLVGLLVSVLSILLVYYANMNSHGNPYYIGGSDDATYERLAYQTYLLGIKDPSLIPGLIIDIHGVGSMYYIILAHLVTFGKWFDGFSTWMPRVLNIFLLIWTSWILFDLFGLINQKVGYITSMIFICFPLVQYVNSHVFRDTLNLFLIFWLVWLVRKLIDVLAKIQIKKVVFALIYVLGVVLATYMLYHLRRNSLIYPVGILGFMLFDRIKIRAFTFITRLYKSKKIVFSAYIVTILVVCAISLYAISKVVNLAYYIEFYTQYKQNQGSEGLSQFVYGAPIIPIGIFLRFFYAFISPFPFLNRILAGLKGLNVDTWMNLQTLGVGIVYMSMPYVIARARKFDWVSNSFLLIFLSIIVTTFTFRHMIFYLPFLLFMAIDEFKSVSWSQRKIYLIDSSIVLLVLMVVYIGLKVVV